MTFAAPMLNSYPADMSIDKGSLAGAIDALDACAQACTACADACLSESADMLASLSKCIRDNLDCADICATTARVLSRHTGYDANVTRSQVQAAMAATQACADSCGEHRDMHEHCRICEQACRQAKEALQQIVSALEPRQVDLASPSAAAPQTA